MIARKEKEWLRIEREREREKERKKTL